MSPAAMSCMAIVQPWIILFGAKVHGWPRSYEESNSTPSVVEPQ